ncbi:hypothetical protein BHE74_00012076 [Ensete ventricosum]|nr:hypothetical protein BHE74_00012076 [Ensete ventricosum]
MSRAGEMGRPYQKTGLESGTPGGLEAVPDRFKAALTFEENKPDFPALGSPVSPLRPHASTQTSSCSTSSGSATSKSVSATDVAVPKPGAGAPDPGRRCHSGELVGGTSPTAAEVRDLKAAAHRRSGSGPLIFSGGNGGGGSGSSSSSTASSPVTNVLPAGNICPSGKIGKTAMMPRTTPRSDVLGSGTGNYGHGSIIRGGMSGGGAAVSSGGDVGMGNLTGANAGRLDPQDVTRTGNIHYKRGQYGEALAFYDKAVAMCPESAACRSNRAAALMGLNRLGEAMKECEEAVRLGLVEDARKHLFLTGQTPDPVELQKLQAVERHLAKFGDARKIRDWKSALREADAAIAGGADSSPLVNPERLIGFLSAESLLHLCHLDEADSVLTRSPKFEDSFPFSTATKIFGMLSFSYFYIVRAQVDMALGRFENAVTAAEKAKRIDTRNIEVAMVLNNIRSVASARAQGNELFKSGNFAEACTAYGEGLKHDPSNPVLLCNRAACRSKLGQWVKSVEDCNEALRIQPSDNEVAEALFHAQVALKASRGEEVSNLKFGGEVEEVTGAEQFRAAVSLSGQHLF